MKRHITWDDADPVYPIHADDIRRLMRRYRVTIRELAARMQIPQHRVRYVRRHGLEDSPHPLHYARDYYGAISGIDYGTPVPFINADTLATVAARYAAGAIWGRMVATSRPTLLGEERHQ